MKLIKASILFVLELVTFKLFVKGIYEILSFLFKIWICILTSNNSWEFKLGTIYEKFNKKSLGFERGDMII